MFVATQGPGEYKVRTFVDDLHGTSFVKEAGASSVEMAMKRAAAIPGPGDYDIGGQLSTLGGAIGKSANKTLIDMAMEHGAKVPGVV